MKNTLLILFFFVSTITVAQDKEAVKKLVAEGIQLHDKGEYNGAIKKYDEALAIDINDFDANYEKSFSLYLAKRYDEAISMDKYILKELPGNPNEAAVYANYGSALDDTGEKEKAMDIYNEGIKKYPDYYLLHFNKGLTLMRINKPDEALLSFQKTLELKPLHVSSNYYTGFILGRTNKIPSLLSNLIFLALEPRTERSKQAFERVQEIMYGNIKKSDNGSGTTITINSGLLDKKNKKKENDFSAAEMMMGLMVVSTNDKQLDKADDAEKLSLQLQLIINSISVGVKDGKGFYWKFYVPFFIAVKQKEYMSTFAHIVLANKNDGAINKWLADNKDKVDDFYFWLRNYKWII